jgi:hypothetical protein
MKEKMIERIMKLPHQRKPRHSWGLQRRDTLKNPWFLWLSP